jgi:hypothetical protein
MMDGRGGNCLYWFLAHPMVLVVVQLMVVAVGIAVEGRRRHDQNTLLQQQPYFDAIKVQP